MLNPERTLLTSKLYTQVHPPYANQSMLYLGKNLPTSRLTDLMAARSAATAPARAGYCTFTATSSPVTKHARCTYIYQKQSVL
ncbi:hypothetical protein DUNSADRAFT_1656 [Dunaliella salina]|uniref:Encoded protein n=1 Tax=Dunaliella salina TaxID=3046 RepID=A0ABQ7FX79_DUNSA|nr:hypothetical protein DUNSADRAFT_1656 [Dunaliella salina]|eukprot:KAF5826969.1 hypothetical protein DUNSADRAFT_1656 [Dunaliella salina]